jgi:hypothetical protein
MGRFSKFLGKVQVKVGEEELNLDKLSVADIQKLVDLSKQKENEIVYGVKVISEIVRKNYPEEPEAEIEAFVMKNYTTLVQEIIIALGWTTREKLDIEVAKASEKKISE